MQLEIQANPVPAPAPAESLLPPWRVYSMAAIYLVAGLVMGYVLRMSQTSAVTAVVASTTAAPRATPGAASSTTPPSLDEIQQVADTHAATLLEKLKSDPSNTMLLMQLGALYHSSHQFKQAAAYYDKAVQTDPKNVAARTKLAISLYREGDVDGAITQLNRTLQDAPGDANALFNLGMIRLEAKQDGPGAVSAWQQLLKMNPHLSADRKAEVQNLVAQVLTSPASQRPQQRSAVR